MFWPSLFTSAASGSGHKSQNWTGWVSSTRSRQSAAGTMVNTENALGVSPCVPASRC